MENQLAHITGSVDSALLRHMKEKDDGDELSQKKHKARKEASQKAKKDVEKLGSDVAKGRFARATVKAVATGQKLHKKIQENGFEGGVFWYVLFLAGVKDALDFVTASTLSWFLSTLIGLMIFLAMRGNGMLFKKYFLKFLISLLLDAVPGIAFLPLTVASVFWVRFSAMRMVGELMSKKKQLEKA